MWREKYYTEVFKVQGGQQTTDVFDYIQHLSEKIIKSGDIEQTQAD